MQKTKRETKPRHDDRLISSRNDNRIKEIRRLHNRPHRDEKQLYHIEGARFLWRAFQSGAHIHSIICAPNLMAQAHKPLIQKFRQHGIPVIEVASEVFHSLAITDNPQGMIALVRQRIHPLRKAMTNSHLCWLALSTVQSPGNFGTIMRTAEAVGATGIFLLSDEIDPYHPATVRASMGSIFALQFVRCPISEFLRWKSSQDFVLIGTSPKAKTDYRLMHYPEKCVIFMGGERKGLSTEHQALCDAMIKIPMEGALDSLNLAIATSIILYEIYNQRRLAITTS